MKTFEFEEMTYTYHRSNGDKCHIWVCDYYLKSWTIAEGMLIHNDYL